MSSFELANAVDKSKTFLVKHSDLEERLDPNFYSPVFTPPAGVVFQRLKDVTHHVFHPPEYPRTFSDTGYQLIRSQNVRPFGLSLLERPVFFSEDFLKDKKVVSAHKGDVLVVRSGVNAGDTAVIEEDLERTIIGADTLLCRCSDRVVPKFLQVYFHTELGKLQMTRYVTGATNKHLNSANLKKILIPIISIDNQKRAIKIYENGLLQKNQKLAQAQTLLDSIDDYLLSELEIELPERAEGLKERMFTTRFSAVSGGRLDPFYNSQQFVAIDQELNNSQYNTSRFAEIIRYIASGATPLKSKKEEFYAKKEDDNRIPLLRVQNITSEGIELRDVVFIKKETHEHYLNRSQVYGGDLLITITGRLGSAAVAESGFEGNINQHSVVVRTEENVVINNYLAAFFNSSIGQRQIARKATGGTRPALDYTALKSIKIPLPPLEKQTEIANHIQDLRIRAKALQTAAEEALRVAQREVEGMILGE